MSNETEVLSKYDELRKEADEMGLSLKYSFVFEDGIFYIAQNSSVIANNLDSLFSVENFLKGYREGYEGCVKEVVDFIKDA